MSKVVKICLIITQPEWGGAQRYVYDLARGLKDGKFDVTVATGHGKPVLLNKLNDVGIQTHKFVHVIRSISLIEEIRAFFELWQYFRYNRFDVVHLNSSKVGVTGAIAAKCAGIKKVVFTAHGFHFNEKMFFLKKFLSIAITWFSFMFIDKVIAVSEYDRHSALALRIISSKKIETIYNGIDISSDYFLQKRDAKEFFLNKIGQHEVQYSKFVGTIANLYKNKGLTHLIDAASRVCKDMPQIVFIIIGEGQERETLERHIARYELEKHVFLVGFIDNPERYLKAFDVCASSSLKEGLPYSLIEARAAGVPIVATAVGGIPEIVGTDGGILVAKENSKELAEKIITVLRAGVDGPLKNDKFVLSEMIEKTLNIYTII